MAGRNDQLRSIYTIRRNFLYEYLCWILTHSVRIIWAVMVIGATHLHVLMTLPKAVCDLTNTTVPTRPASHPGPLCLPDALASTTASTITEVQQADMRLLGRERGMRDDRMEHSFFNIFRKAGMHTVSISTFAERHSAFWFNAGFNEMINVGKGGSESSEEVIPHALDWIKRRGHEDQWFMHLHLWDTHTPCRTPEDFQDPFTDSPASDWIDETIFQNHIEKVGQHSLHELGGFKENPRFRQFPKQRESATTMDELRQVLDGYDGSIRYMDGHIGRLIRLLKDMDIYDDMAIIITSDHGEDLGELGIYSEHGVSDYCVTHIPLLIKWPGMSPGTDSQFHYNIDLAPTMCELLGVKPYPWWDGQSFASVLKKKWRCRSVCGYTNY